MEATIRASTAHKRHIVEDLRRRGDLLFVRVAHFDSSQGGMESIAVSDWKAQEKLERQNARSLAESLEQLCRASGQNEVHAKIDRLRIVTQRWGDHLVTVMFFASDPVSKSLKRLLRRVAKKRSKGVKSPGAYAPITATPEISRPSSLRAGNP